jgi:uncharacterized NAD(P)/FAD-binding protein YdhS
MGSKTQDGGSHSKPVVAIVGGGFAGTMVAVHLLKSAQQPLRIVLIERDDVPGRGVAYRDQPECHLLNVRAEAMSAFPSEPDHFLNWLNAAYSPCHPVGTAEYLPRRLYGAYIESVLEQAQADARRGVTLELRSDEVLGLSPSSSGAKLRLKSGGSLSANQIVLALGNPGPADPPVSDGGFYSSTRYQGHAWSTPGLLAIQRDERVLLVGSGLTTLDWLAALRDRGHRGRIHVVSRHGLMPQLHRPASLHHLSFDPLALPPKVSALLKRLRTEIEMAEAAGGDWRGVIDALRPYSQRLWQRLAPVEQRRFLRHVRPYWEIHRHRAAPKIVDTVYALLRTGQLQVSAARLVRFEETGDGVDVLLQPRHREQLETLSVDRVVNCTGPESNYRRLNHPLVRSLREKNLIEADELGLGLRTDDHGALLSSDGIASSWLHTLGPSRKGQLWETTAVPEIRVQAQALALRLLQGVETARRTASATHMPVPEAGSARVAP